MPAGKTKTHKSRHEGEELPSELDFAKLKFVGRGLFAGKTKSGGRQVRLAADVARVFSTEKAVNDALRMFINAAKTVTR